MTLHFRPLPPACEPKPIRAARDALRIAWNHPDAAEVERVLDVLAHAVLRLGELHATIADAAIREAISGQHGGLTGALADAVNDVAYALECWAESPWNEPRYLAECEATDFRNLAEREAR